MSAYATPASLLESEADLVSLPDVLLRLQDAIADPRSSAESISGIIINDPALTTRLLKLANSPVYGFSGRIDTVSRALTLVGIEPLYHLALATFAVSSFRNIPTHLVDMDEFWMQSTCCGVVARLLAREACILQPERMFVAGLLHAIGDLLIYCKCPDKAREILLASQGRRELIPLLERDLLGFTYAEVGAEILRRWNMPPWLQEAVGSHLHPEKAGEYIFGAALLYLADRLTDVQIQGDAVEDVLAEIPGEILDLTRLQEGQILRVMAGVYAEFAEVAGALLSG